jgi:predicted transcriptional regulator
MKNPKTIPTDLELEILKLIWRRGRATVREVYLDFLQERKIAYTTVLTMMGVLERKGHLKKKRGERAYVYFPAQPQARVMDGMVREFVNRVFSGSRKPLMVHLVEDADIDAEELDEIEALLRERRKKR